LSDNSRLQIITEARAIIGGDDVPLWSVVAALALGYQGEGVVLHVARVILEWHDLYAVKTDRAAKIGPR